MIIINKKNASLVVYMGSNIVWLVNLVWLGCRVSQRTPETFSVYTALVVVLGEKQLHCPFPATFCHATEKRQKEEGKVEKISNIWANLGRA